MQFLLKVEAALNRTEMKRNVQIIFNDPVDV